MNRTDWDAFIEARRSGSIDARGRPVADGDREPVTGRTVKRDLQGLRAAFAWGVGADLLDRNPCANYPYPQLKQRKQPRLTQKRYEAMLEVAGAVDWRFELALILAHETGHRIRSIRHLQWSDIDLSERLVRWRAESDKTGQEHVTPLTETAARALRTARSEHLAVGDTWVLPSPTEPTEPISRHLLRDWWYRAEEAAELAHIDGLGWHGLRRKFADEHRGVPVKDLADLGGWATPRTILEVYQDSDLGAMRAAQQKREPLPAAESG